MTDQMQDPAAVPGADPMMAPAQPGVMPESPAEAPKDPAAPAA